MQERTNEATASNVREFWSALTVRLGIAGGCVLGGFVGYWIEAVRRTKEEEVLMWPAIVGGIAGLAVAAFALTSLARKHKGLGAFVGGVLAIAAVVTLLAWFTRWHWG